MNIIKYFALFAWAFILFGTMSFIVKQLVFRKRKGETTINPSESIYLAALIISIGLILQKIIISLSSAFDNIYKIQPNDIFLQFIKTGSSVSVCGIIILFISMFISNFFLSLFFGRRKDSIEFESDNKYYALIKGVLVSILTLCFLQVADDIFTYLIPTITLPFYR